MPRCHKALEKNNGRSAQKGELVRVRVSNSHSLVVTVSPGVAGVPMGPAVVESELQLRCSSLRPKQITKVIYCSGEIRTLAGPGVHPTTGEIFLGFPASQYLESKNTTGLTVGANIKIVVQE